MIASEKVTNQKYRIKDEWLEGALAIESFYLPLLYSKSVILLVKFFAIGFLYCIEAYNTERLFAFTFSMAFILNRVFFLSIIYFRASAEDRTLIFPDYKTGAIPLGDTSISIINFNINYI